MLQSWFEMKDIERRKYDNSVWIPLYASQQLEKIGTYGYDGYREEYFGCGTLAVPVEKKDIACKLGWMDIGIVHSHSPWIDGDGIYRPAELYIKQEYDLEGVCLALKQYMEQPEKCEWHLNQDFVLALGLKRECDTWVRPSEGYVEVVHIKRKSDGTPYLLEVRAEHLKDYLCARKMTLLMTTYRQRQIVTIKKPQFTWNKDMVVTGPENYKWLGYIREIHEGGSPYGEKMAIFHSARTDIDESEDIPVMDLPTDDNITLKSWTKSFSGDKRFSIIGELWRNEWIKPSENSHRVAGDRLPPTVYFITNAEGKRESRETLLDGGRWLWFRPSIVMDLLTRRGGSMKWYTAQTGELGCLQSNTVHFGVNSMGLINVYAKDIAQLPDWQQQIWAGHNIAPEGKLSAELFASQVKAEPANTRAPEELFEKALKIVNELSMKKLGFYIFKQHDAIPEIVKKCHRFRAIDKAGLYALAKDLTRLTADSIDVSKIQKIVKPPNKEKWGSLKSLEKLLATKIDPEKSRHIIGHLVGIYELRLADAHLPSNDIENALELIGIDNSVSSIHQGYQMMCICFDCIQQISQILKEW